jgi:basic membrane protein A and related proteins
MKKNVWLVGLLVAALVLLAALVAACGDDESTTGGAGETTAGEGTDATAGEDVESIRAAMVTDVGKLGDKSFNDGVWAGLQQAEQELGAGVNYLVSEQQTDYVPNLTRLVDDGNQVIFAVGFLMSDAIQEVAAQFPDVWFAGIDIELQSPDFEPVDVDNIREVLFAEQQAGYLAGIVAAGMTVDGSLHERLNDDKVVGVVAGMKIPPVDRYIAGFVAGVKSVDPDVRVLLTYTDTFDDPNAGKEAAVPMYDQGADIVFQVAGRTGLGVFEAARDANALAIGVDVDQYDSLPEVMLTSAEKKLAQATFLTVQDAAQGNFTAGDVLFDLANDGVGLAPFHDYDDVVPQSVKDMVEQAQQDIIEGAIDVPAEVDDTQVNR